MEFQNSKKNQPTTKSSSWIERIKDYNTPSTDCNEQWIRSTYLLAIERYDDGLPMFFEFKRTIKKHTKEKVILKVTVNGNG